MSDKDRPLYQLCVAVLAVVCLVAPALTLDAQENLEPVDPETVVFIPPEIGAPRDRIGAGTRGIESTTEIIQLLIPQEGGLTTSDKPPIIWQVKTDFTGTMISEIAPYKGGDGVMLERQGLFQAGYYALDLGRSEYQLKPGTVYSVSVVLVKAGSDADPARAEGLVERVPTTSKSHDTYTAARAGLWFDAIAPLVRVDFSGRAMISNEALLVALAQSAGIPQ